MAKTLEQILGYKTLTGIMQSPLGGVPSVWDERFFTTTKEIDGDTADMIVVNATRQNAPTVAYGSASRRVNPEVVSGRSGKCIHSFYNMVHKTSTLTALRNMDDANQQRKAQQYIDMQTVEARRRGENLRISALNSIFRYGALYIDANGNLLPSSSGAAMTVDMQVPTNNKNQCNSAISASWATAGTDILGNLSNIKKAAVQNSGRQIRRAYYGSDIPKYLRGNTDIKAMMTSDSAMSASLRQNKIPAGFGIEGIEWIPLDVAFFVDSENVVREWFPSDFIVFTPEVDQSWYEMQEGSYLVPGDINTASDAQEALASMETVYGMGSYAKLDHDPVSLKQYFFDTFLPVLRDPAAVYLADVVF